MKRTVQVGKRRAPARVERRREQETHAALAMAALYRLIARGFAYPDRAGREAIGAILGEIGTCANGDALSSQLLGLLRAFSRAWRMTPPGDLAAEYSRLFLGAGLVPLREGGYGDGLRFAGQPFDIADLNGFYAAFGFALNQEAPSPPDFLGTEAEFLSLLHLKKALALRKRERERVLIVERAMARFLTEHLGRWVNSLGDALREAGAVAPYTALQRLLRECVGADCARLKARPRPARCGIAPDPLAKDRLECPFAGREPKRSEPEIAA